MGVDGGSMSARMIDSAHVALVIKKTLASTVQTVGISAF
jgi:hypothetical protein